MAMYWLVPDEPHLGFIQVAVIFVAATLLGFASHAPGGLGVFDATMMVALWQFDKEDLLAGLLLFRLLYYIIPFMLSLLILGGREALLGRTCAAARATGHSVDALGRRAGAGKIGRDLIRLAAGRLRGAVSMSLNDDRVALQRGGWRRLRLMIITAAAVFAALTILDALTVGYAVTGFPQEPPRAGRERLVLEDTVQGHRLARPGALHDESAGARLRKEAQDRLHRRLRDEGDRTGADCEGGADARRKAELVLGVDASLELGERRRRLVRELGLVVGHPEGNVLREEDPEEREEDQQGEQGADDGDDSPLLRAGRSVARR